MPEDALPERDPALEAAQRARASTHFSVARTTLRDTDDRTLSEQVELT